MTPDPRWLEILKASGWQNTALAGACGSFLLLGISGALPPLDSWVAQLTTFALLVFGCLALASFASATIKLFPIHLYARSFATRHAERRAALSYLPHMTDTERRILGYLLARNQKTFTAAQDGGYANTLVSRGFVWVALRPSQVFSPDDVPMVVPDHIWNILIEHRDSFPDPGDEDGYPWRVPWDA